ncbi:hypothetical protein BJX96DRAFT_177491 [Aspergillus floccosus]
MLPPSDSLRHQFDKRSEARANTQCEDRRAPPPPYSPSIRLPPSIESFLRGNDLDEYDEADEADYVEPESCAPRITIHIDASISIIGDANTVVIPPSSTPCPADLLNTGSNQSNAMTALQAAQRARQTKLTDMATAIIDALGRSGLLDLDRAGCPAPAPVEVKITQGIRVEGSRNAVCVGAFPRALGRSSVPGAVERDGGRKRRACSEPVESPASKRAC